MKKQITLFFIFIYLFSFTEMKQALKLPHLIVHFIEHQSDNPNMSIYAFIKMHYLDTPIQDADYKEDLKLPFKTHDISYASLNLQIPSKVFEFSFLTHLFYKEKNQHFLYSEPITILYINGVFRPPILG